MTILRTVRMHARQLAYRAVFNASRRQTLADGLITSLFEARGRDNPVIDADYVKLGLQLADGIDPSLGLPVGFELSSEEIEIASAQAEIDAETLRSTDLLSKVVKVEDGDVTRVYTPLQIGDEYDRLYFGPVPTEATDSAVVGVLSWSRRRAALPLANLIRRDRGLEPLEWIDVQIEAFESVGERNDRCMELNEKTVQGRRAPGPVDNLFNMIEQWEDGRVVTLKQIAQKLSLRGQIQFCQHVIALDACVPEARIVERVKEGSLELTTSLNGTMQKLRKPFSDGLKKTSPLSKFVEQASNLPEARARVVEWTNDPKVAKRVKGMPRDEVLGNRDRFAPGKPNANPFLFQLFDGVAQNSQDNVAAATKALETVVGMSATEKAVQESLKAEVKGSRETIRVLHALLARFAECKSNKEFKAVQAEIPEEYRSAPAESEAQAETDAA